MKILRGQVKILQILCAVCTVVVGIMSIIGCDGKDNEKQKDFTQPVLSVSPVDMLSVTSIIPFGADLSPGRKNPAFEYYVDSPDVQVRASCGGVVKSIWLNDNFPDYEVWIRPSSESVYFVQYDHVIDLEVIVGERVTSGQVLGTVGSGNRTELVIGSTDGGDVCYCPFDFATDEFIQEHMSFTNQWCLVDTVLP